MNTTVKSLLVFSFILFSLGSLSAQKKHHLRLDGKIREGKQKLSDVKVALIKEGEEVDKVITDKNGKFMFKLPLEANYYMVFSKNGYRSKYIDITAVNIPAEDAEFGFEFGGLDVSLFKDVKRIESSVLDKPVAKIIYDTIASRFIFDRLYFDEVQDEMEKLQAEVDEIQNNKNELLALEQEAITAEAAERKKLEEEAALAQKTEYERKQKEIEEQKEMEKQKNIELRKKMAEQELALKKMQEDELLKKQEEEKKHQEIEQIAKQKKLEEDRKKIAEYEKLKLLEAEKKKQEDEKRLAESIENSAKKPNTNDSSGNLTAEPYMTEEIFRQGNKTITKRLVYIGSSVEEYRKIVADWGGRYFFKNNTSVTESQYEQETSIYKPVINK